MKGHCVQKEPETCGTGKKKKQLLRIVYKAAKR